MMPLVICGFLKGQTQCNTNTLSLILFISTNTAHHLIMWIIIFEQGRMILAHLCDEPKGLKSGMFMVWLWSLLTKTSCFGLWYFFVFWLQMLSLQRSTMGKLLMCLFHLVLVTSERQLFYVYTKWLDLLTGRSPLVDELVLLLLYCAYTGELEHFQFHTCILWSFLWNLS